MKQVALTLSGNGILNVLKTKVDVSVPFTGTEGKLKNTVIIGIWDTGATNCSINKSVVDALDLKPIGMAEVHTASATVKRNVYLVNITLPSNVIIPGVRVTEGNIVGADMLIGMDVINHGDFSITNFKDKTKMTFRVPSCHEIDYVEMIKNTQKKGITQKYLPRAGKRKIQRKKRKRK